MATIFLSYSRDDVEHVEPLAVALEHADHTVWWDRHISAGEEFAGAIEQALEAADVVIVVWTCTSVRSAWVRDEAAAGRDRGRLVPVTLDGCLPPLGFRQYQTIDLSEWNGRATSEALDPLIDAIGTRAGAEPSERPKAPPTKRLHKRVGRSARLAAAVAATLLLMTGGFVYTWLSAGSGPIAPKVAIGGFALHSRDIPAELPNLLGQEVLAAFGAENAVTVIAPVEAQDEASAPFIMDGSISRVGQGVRFAINLKNRRSGVLLWSGAYEHEAIDVLGARQAAVGASQVIRCGLWGAANHKKRMSDQALSLYFQWCNEHWSGASSITAELDAARRVTAVVPDFSFGWSALALAAAPLAQAADTADAAQLRQEAEQAAHKSIRLNDQNPEGYMALAGLLALDRYNEREKLLRKAISVRKTECGCERQAYGDFLASVGRMEEAVEQYERAKAMRPLAPFSNLRLAQALYIIGRNDEADQILAKSIQLWPQATSLQLLKIKSALWTRRYDEAISLLGAPDLPLTSLQRDALIAAFGALRAQDSAPRSRAAADLERLAADPRRNDRIVVATLAALGAREAALRAATNLVRNRGLLETEVLFEPNLAAASVEPSYTKLVHDLGLTAYWRSGRNAPDICREAARPRFCSLA